MYVSHVDLNNVSAQVLENIVSQLFVGQHHVQVLRNQLVEVNVVRISVLAQRQ